MSEGADEKLCPYCAETIKASAAKCKHCGEFLDGNRVITKNPAAYGAISQPAQPQIVQQIVYQNMPNTGIAYLLWLLFGMLGIHKFYIGDNTSGIWYLILGLIGFSTISFGIGFLPLAIVGLCWLVDLFTIPSQISARYKRDR